jgi:hypothetical protein
LIHPFSLPSVISFWKRSILHDNAISYAAVPMERLPSD